MRTIEYKVSFTTPAFLGNAEQQAQWRTPPFKALIRQWWRVVKANDFGYDVSKLLFAEKQLFGAAGEEGKPWGKSLVRLRLTKWDTGNLASLPRMATHQHPEVKNRQTGAPIPVGTAVYLGFGPVTTQGNRSAIDPDLPGAKLQLCVPNERAFEIERAIQLASWFGALGSRSRNGWGGLQVTGEGLLDFFEMTDAAIAEIAPTLSLDECLRRDWPHAVGLADDGRLAVWRVIKEFRQTEKGNVAIGFDSWREILEKLAHIKITFRTEFEFNGGKPHSAIQRRHVLAYPVTNHDLAGMTNHRLASQLRLKVIRQKGKDNDKFFGVIVHLPCAMPAAFFKDTNIAPPSVAFQAGVWRQVHGTLNTKFPGSVVRVRKAIK